MQKIAICDKKDAISEISKNIMTIRNKNDINFEFEGFCSEKELIESLREGDCYDITFLEIEIVEMDVIEYIKKLESIMNIYLS